MKNTLFLCAAWGLYCTIHSLLAAEKVQQNITRCFPFLHKRYRLFYNLVSVILLAIPLAAMKTVPSHHLWTWTDPWSVVQYTLLFAVVAGFVWSARFYDMKVFLGVNHKIPEQETAGRPTLVISPMHRFVRHPWYFLGLVFLWTRNMDLARLVTAACLTVYIIIGAHLEETRLVGIFGYTYRRYQNAVPALFPLPWKFLKKGNDIL